MLRWHVVGKSECSSKCGNGYRTLEVLCMRYSRMKRGSERVESRVCADLAKPQSREPCHGDCLLKSWQYSAWSQVSCSQLLVAVKQRFISHASNIEIDYYIDLYSRLILRHLKYWIS